MKNFKKQFFFNLLILILIGLFFTVLFWPEKEKEKPQPKPAAVKKEMPREAKNDAEFEKTKLASLNNDKKEWELSAKNITYDQRKQTAHADKIICVFFKPDKGIFATMKAEGADINLNTNSLKFIGTVSAELKTGEKMEIQKLWWDGLEKKAFGTGFVKINNSDADLTGDKLIIIPSESKIEINGNVKIKIKKFKKNN